MWKLIKTQDTEFENKFFSIKWKENVSDDKFLFIELLHSLRMTQK